MRHHFKIDGYHVRVLGVRKGASHERAHGRTKAPRRGVPGVPGCPLPERGQNPVNLGVKRSVTAEARAVVRWAA